MFIITLAFTAHCCHGEQSNTQLCTALKIITKTKLITKTDFFDLSPKDGQSESLIDLNMDLDYDTSYVYVHWSNNELKEIDKDVDRKGEEDLNAELDDNASILNAKIEDDVSKEDAGNETNNDISLFGNSDKYNCSRITR